MKASKIIPIILIIVSVLTVTIAVTAKIYERKFGPIVLKNINQKLSTPVEVENISFTIIKKFPKASFELHNVLIKSSPEFQQKNGFPDLNTDTLIYAASVFLEFNALDLLKKKFNISTINISKGKINLFTDKNGLENYLVLEQENESTQNGIAINLENVAINDVDLIFINQLKNFHTRVGIKDLNFEGSISNQMSKMAAYGEIFIHNLKINNTDYRMQRTCELNLNLDKQENSFELVNSFLKLSGMMFNISGKYINSKVPKIDISIKAKKTELNSIIHLLPKAYTAKYKKYETFGNFSFVANISGAISKIKTPGIRFNFSLADGSFINNKTNMVLSDLNVEGYYSNGKSRSFYTSFFNLKNISFIIDSSSFQGSFQLSNFINPEFKIKSHLNVELAQLQQFFNIDTIKTASGKLISTLWFTASFEDFKNPLPEEIRNIKLSGETYIENGKLQIEKSTHLLKDINAKVIFADTDLRLSQLSFTDGDNKFKTEGLLLNFIPFLFFENEKLFVDANIHANYFDLSSYISTPKKQNKTSDTTSIIFPDNLSFSLGLDIDNLVYDKFRAYKAKSLLHYQDKSFTAEKIEFNSMEGSVSGTGFLKQDTDNNLVLNIDSKLSKLNINQLFASFNNFGQNFLIDENLKGQVDGSIKYSGQWTSNMKLDKDKIVAEADLVISNGELIDFEPMQSLSQYVDVKELEHIKFATLQNNIYIKENRVIIPNMNIVSSALNIGVSGEHTFSNEIDYHINVLLSDVLSKRFRKNKKREKEFTNIEDDGLGRTTLYLAITGNVEDYKVSYDRKKVRKKIRDELQQEKQEIKSILKDEFSFSKKNSFNKKREKKGEETEKMIFEFEGDTLK